jgi:hypothetical protein
MQSTPVDACIPSIKVSPSSARIPFFCFLAHCKCGAQPGSNVQSFSREVIVVYNHTVLLESSIAIVEPCKRKQELIVLMQISLAQLAGLPFKFAIFAQSNLAADISTNFS